MRDLPAWLEEFTENLVDESVPAHWDAPASSSRESASVPRVSAARKSGIGQTQHLLLTSRKTEIARSVRGPKLQGPRAENAPAQPYLEQTNLVT